MKFAALACLAWLTSAQVEDCANPAVAVAPEAAPTPENPDVTRFPCRIVDAGGLPERSSLEFVDVRPSPVREPVSGARVLTMAQLDERPPASGLTRVLLGDGLNDSVVAQQCQPVTATRAYVLKGGVRSWQVRFSGLARAPGFEVGRKFAEVSVAEALAARSTFAFDTSSEQTLARMLDAKGLNYVDIDEMEAGLSAPIVFLTDYAGSPPMQALALDYYLLGGVQALRRELIHAQASAKGASTVLRRPCYLP